MQKQTIYKSFIQNSPSFRATLHITNVLMVYSLTKNMFSLVDFWNEYSMLTILYSFSFRLLYIATTFQTLAR